MFKPSRQLLALGLAGAALCAPAPAQEPWPDPGPPATRDLFPLNLVPLAYRPSPALTLGRGKVLVSLQVTRENTFEFSDRIKDAITRDNGGRISVTREGSDTFAQSHAQEPLLYFFDGEVQRTELCLRTGVSDRTDVAITLAWQGFDGGMLDGLIEGFHRLGFEQAGRTGVARDQAAVVVMQKGEVVLFSEDCYRFHPEDPVLNVIHRIHESPRWTLALTGSLQVPLTRWRGTYQSDWDSSVGLSFQWRPSPNLAVDGGMATLRRKLKQTGPAPFFIRDQAGAHLGWQWLGWRGVRPFLVLVGTSGITAPGPGSKLDKPSLIHDLGFHVRLSSRSSMTLSYINNITHNENTADMGISLRLSLRP